MVVNLNASRLSDDMTNDEWQRAFAILKACNKPVKVRKMSVGSAAYNGTFDGETNWHSYVQYINSVLKVIRSGETDYCYFICQIKDLLLYEPNLKAIWVESGSYFMVSL